MIFFLDFGVELTKMDLECCCQNWWEITEEGRG